MKQEVFEEPTHAEEEEEKKSDPVEEQKFYVKGDQVYRRYCVGN